VRLLARGAVAAAAGLLSCGGLAADGPEPGGSGPSTSPPGEEPAEPIRPYRETCEDNPLLADCPRPEQSFGGAPPPQPDTAEEPLVIAVARNVLSSYCGACHGSGLTAGAASASINYIDDWSQLLAAGLIERCAPERSRVVSLMRSGAMPPPDSGRYRVSEAEIELVEAAIDLDCAGQ
jgi:hypothetical protein